MVLDVQSCFKKRLYLSAPVPSPSIRVVILSSITWIGSLPLKGNFPVTPIYHALAHTMEKSWRAGVDSLQMKLSWEGSSAACGHAVHGTRQELVKSKISFRPIVWIIGLQYTSVLLYSYVGLLFDPAVSYLLPRAGFAAVLESWHWWGKSNRTKPAVSWLD